MTIFKRKIKTKRSGLCSAYDSYY